MSDPPVISQDVQSPFLTTIQAARYLHLAPGTLAIWRCQGRGPKFALCATKILYRISDLEAFVDSCHVRRKASTGAGRPRVSKKRRVSR